MSQSPEPASTPASAPTFIAAELIGAMLAVVLLRMLCPGITPDEAENVVLAGNLRSTDRFQRSGRR